LVAYASEIEVNIPKINGAKEPQKRVLAGYSLFCFPCYSWKGESLHMEDIYIRPNFRRIGLGLTMLKKLLTIILEENFVSMSWDVLANNHIGIEFYKKIGGIDITDSKNGGYWLHHLREDRFDHVLELANKYSWGEAFSIVEATPEHAPEIYRLTLEVARVEGRPDYVEISVEQIADFLRRKMIYGLLVYAKGKESGGDSCELAGMSLYRYQYSTWKGQFIWLDDLYIEEKFRRHGIGLLFMVELVRLSKSKGIRRIGFTMVDSNRPAELFYQKIGAINLAKEDGWLTYRLYRPQIDRILADD